jgi:hypothetical protein
MSIKSKVLAGAAAASVIAGGVGVAAAATANASTPSCGSACVSITNGDWGHRFVIDAYKQNDVTGNKVILFSKSNSDPGQDFTVADQASVNEFYSLGLVSAALDLHYGNKEAVEIQYSPWGSGGNNLCVGVGTTAGNGTPVTLQPCGETSKTLWVEDWTKTGLELINGSDTNFSHPYVMSYPGTAAPTDNPRPGLFTWSQVSFSNGAGISSQTWHGLS